MESGNTKSQQEHYVPQCYLKHFASNKDKNQIYVYDKTTQKSFQTNIKNVASKKNFYDLIEPEIKNNNQDIETFFSEVETDYNSVIGNILRRVENKRSITQNMKGSMSLFITFQILRTESQRKYYGELIEKITKTNIETTNKLSEAEKNKLDELEIDKEFEKEQHIELLFDLDILRTSTEILDKHIWIIGINATSTPLYTSDNPVVRKSHKKDKIHSYSAFGSEGIEIAFPLTPGYVLVLKEMRYFHNLKNMDKKSINLTANEVKYYNDMQIIQCERQIFSPLNKFSQVKNTINKKKSSTKDGGRIQVNQFFNKYGIFTQFKDLH